MAAVVTDPANILDSRLSAYETEILKLKNENKTFKVDASEAKNAMTKLANELRLSQETLKAIQTENKTLKLSLKETDENLKTLRKNLNNHKNTNEQLTIRVEEDQKMNTELRLLSDNAKKEIQELKQNHETVLSQMQMAHAKELGKLQNSKQNDLDARVNRFAKMENALKNEISTLQKQSNLMDREYKDTIAAQAQRLCAYEQQINIMEKQMNRLSIQNEFKSIPKINDTERQMMRLEAQNDSLIHDNKAKDKEINNLINRLNMTRLNQHYDFRNKGNF
tara:strand:+ start:517 stop:1353 length:837 start_codon:yes stop_codon:yes gene_type:complete